MPFGSVTLTPGVNSERTPTLLRAGISQSSLIRFRDSLVQKYGGWQKYYQYAVAGVPRDMHAWEDLNLNKHLFVGTTTQGAVITNNSLTPITPQTLVSNFAPNFSTTATSPLVTIIDPNITDVTVYDSVFFNVPVSVGGLILDGLYPITVTQVAGSHSYQITAATAATTTETNPTATNNTTASGNPTLHFASTPSWVAGGMVIFNLNHPASIPANTLVSSTTSTTVVMTGNAASPGVSSGDDIVFCSVPLFTTTSGSSVVNVGLLNHGQVVGNTVVFAASTTASGVTISGSYDVITYTDVNNFSIQASTQATASSIFAMNGGEAQLVYSIALGPPPLGSGYGTGGYGGLTPPSTTYGYGGVGGSSEGVQIGTPITATDWTSDNWGEILIACPKGGGIYYWDPTGGFQNLQIISSGPIYNNGIFVSMSEQILVAYGSTVEQGIGYQQQPMLVQWCDVGNFFQWNATAQDQAGNFVIPIGSSIMAGLAVSNQNLILTDLDLWAMSYIGPPDVFGFNKIGAGMGAVSSHSVQQLRGSVYWMGTTNFYSYTSNGANVIPCPVWDAVFGNINTNYLQNVRAMPNTPFNECGFLYPSAASTSGECDSYVKFNISEPGTPWDYGPTTQTIPGTMQFARSAWIDQSVIGMPIGASPGGVIYQHETTPDADGQPLIYAYLTGYFYIGEGEDFCFIDQIYPDFIWESYTGTQSANVQLSFYLVNYPGDTPTIYGPYTCTQATEFLSVRFRGRQMAILVQGSDLGSFSRLGMCRYRYSPSGRR